MDNPPQSVPFGNHPWQLAGQRLCMTDWASTWDGEKLAASGNDLEKPDGFSLRRAREKLLGSPGIDRMALGILKTCIAGGGVEMDWAPSAAAIVHAFYGGQTGADALADVLAGRINPSGKLPFTIEKHFADSPGHAYADKPHDIGASFPAAMVERKRLGSFMSRENKTVIGVHNIHYKEGVFTGYRWHDAGKIEPRFAFGHGLSYTKFEYGSLAIKRMEGGRIGVSFTLKNTGRRAGDEIAQLYVADVKSSVPRPPKQLKGFKRVSLAPGESQSITIEVDAGALGFWDAGAHGWKVEPGEFEVLVGPSSRDLPLRGIFEI